MFSPETARFRATMTKPANPKRRIVAERGDVVIAAVPGTPGRGSAGPLCACVVSRSVL